MVLNTWKPKRPNPVYLVPPHRERNLVAAVGLGVGLQSGAGFDVRHGLSLVASCTDVKLAAHALAVPGV